MAKQYNTGNPFDNLSYSEYVPTFVGTPINDIKALNEKKEKDYYDTLNATDVVRNMANINALPSDQELLSKIQGDIDNYINDIMAEGDLENKSLQMRKYITDIANNSGLKEIQQKVANRQAYIDAEWERYKAGDISRNEMETNIQLADKMSNPVIKNEITGKWEGSWNGRNATNKFDPSEYLKDVIGGGFKADGINFTDANGNILYDTGNGYFVYQDGTQVSPDEVAQAALLSLQNNPNAQDWIQSQVYLNNARRFTLQDKEPTAQDVSNILKNSPYALQTLEKLGLSDTSVEGIQKVLDNTGKTPEELIGQIDTAELLGSAIVPIVNMESFTNISPKFLDNWLLKEELKFEADKNKSSSDEEGVGSDPYINLISTISSEEGVNPLDMTNMINGWNSEAENLRNLEAQLVKAEQDIENNVNIDPNSLTELRQKIEASAKRVGQYKEQVNFVRDSIKDRIDNSIFDESYNYYSNIISNKKATLEKELKNLNNKKGLTTLDYARINTIQKELNSLNILPKDKFITKAIDKYTQNSDGTTISRNMDIILGTDEYGYMGNDDLLELSLNRGSKAIKDNIGELSANPLKKDYVTISSAAPAKYNKLEQLSGELLKTLNIERNAFGLGNQDIETLVKNQYDLDPDEVDWNKSQIIPIFDVHDGKPMYRVSIHTLAKGNDSKNVGSLNVTMNGSNDSSVLVDIAEEHIGAIINRSGGMNSDGSINFSNNQDRDTYKMLSRYYAELSPIGQSLDNVNVYAMKAGDTKSWNTGIEGMNAITIEAMKDVNATRGVHDMNYKLKVNGKTLGTNDKGKFGWWADSDLATPKSFDTAAEIKSEIGGKLLNNSYTNKKQQTQVGNNPYTNYRNTNVSIAVSHNNPGNIKFGEFAKKYGAIEGRSATDGGKFAVFPDVQTGLRARTDLLLGNSYKNLTVDAAMKRWSNSDYGGEIYAEIKDKTIAELSKSELDELIKRQTKREDINMYKSIYGS